MEGYSAGKLRVRNGGDNFWTTRMSHRTGQLERRNCYIWVRASTYMYIHAFSNAVSLQYEIVFQDRSREVKHLGYGDLENILVITLPVDPFFASLNGATVALALIVPWNTEGKDASKENVYMTSRRATFVTDIRNLKVAVGLVQTGGRWGIIDRSGELGIMVDLGEDRETTGDLDSDIEI